MESAVVSTRYVEFCEVLESQGKVITAIVCAIAPHCRW